MRAEALSVSEELVASYARKNGLNFEVALGRLLDKRSLSSSSNAVKALNFHDPSMRGMDLKRSILNIEKFSKNAFAFKSNLMKIIGAKNTTDLNKKIVDYEFKNPLMLISALGAQFNRLEMRYMLNGISFQEALARRIDFDNTLMSICNDLYNFGLTENILHFVHEFSSELIDPKLKLDCIKESNVEYVSRKGNNNNTKIDVNNITALAADSFAYNGVDLLYNINEELGCQIKLQSPIHDLYTSKRTHFGNSNKNESLRVRWLRGERPKFCPNRACRDYNFGIEGCPHAVPCKIKKDEHELSHYCAYCGPGAKHRIFECEFIRCCTAIIKCTDSSWLSKIYTVDIQRIWYPRNNRRPGYNNRRNNFRNNTYPNAASNANNFGGYGFDNNDRNNNYDNGGYNNDNSYSGSSSQHYNNNGGGRRGKNKRRGNRDNHGNNGNSQYNQFNAPHNGNA